MKRPTIQVLVILLALNAVAYAQTRSVVRNLNAEEGRDVKLGIFASMRRDCTAGTPPTIRLKVPPKHGKVVVKAVKLRATNLHQCLAVEVPAFVAIYRSVPNYFGYDLVVLEIKSGTKVQTKTYIIKLGARSGSRRIESKAAGKYG